MRFYSKSLILILISFSFISTGSQSAELQRESSTTQADCEKDQRSMDSCSAYRYKELNNELNLLYKTELAKLETAGNLVSKKRLLTAQKDWLKYVHSDCLLRNGEKGSVGSIWWLEHNECMSEHIQFRINILKELISGDDCTQDTCNNL